MFSIEYFVCVLGIYTCFLTWGVLQERVTTTSYFPATPDNNTVPQKFKFFIVLNLCQSLTACAIGTCYLYIKNQHTFILKVMTNPALLFNLVKISFLNSIASPFGYQALKYIDYPTMILAKSCKLIPVMAISVLVNRIKYPKYQYLAVLLITVGVSIFMMNHDQHKPQASKTTSIYGLILLSMNLLIDGLTNTSQDQVFKQFHVIKGQHMMVLMNLISSIIMSVYLTTVSTEWSLAVDFIRDSGSLRVLVDIFLFSVAGGLGQVFIFHTLGAFGSLSLVSITVTRKLMSILVSVFLYNHDLNFVQWGAVVVVFVGIGIESLGKYQSKSQKSKAPDSKEQEVPLLSNGSSASVSTSASTSTGSKRKKNAKLRKRID